MNVRKVLSSLSILALAACGSDNGIGPSSGDELSETEAVEIASAISSVMSAIADPSAASNASVAGVPQNISVHVDQTVPCPMGGDTHLSFNMNGTVDEEAQSFSLNLQGSNAPAACAILVQEETVSLTGTPSLTSSAHIEVEAGEPVGNWTSGAKGRFAWTSTDGRSGSCSVDYTQSINFDTQSVSMSGHFCGATIEYSGPMTAFAASMARR
jgi:hypothetical protein